MNQKSDGPITSAEDSVHELVAEFHRLEDQGSPISSADFIAQHSEHAEALQSYFAGIAAVNGMTDPPPLEQTFIPSDTQAVGNDQTVIEDSVSINANRRVSADAPPTKFGRYKILKELGRGAMGAVYLAQDEQLDRKVALKIPQFGGALNSGLLERFYREARAAGNLRHPGICPVYDVGEIDGQHYITMAYIEGRPLRDFSKSSKRQADKQTARVIRKIALAMAEAHDQNVIHRDLKPANIMIDTKNEPVVMDFGLARRAAEGEERLTHTGTVIGTPAYMSPEQVDGDNENVGPAADIYSLGVIFYELLTGELPFQGNLMSILKQISMKQPRPPVELHADVDLFLQALCLKMLEKDVKDRPESMSQIAKELSDWLQGKHAPTDESAMLETSQAPARSKKKTASTVEVTDPMATPGIAREVPESEESPDFDDAPLAATTVAPRRAVSAATSPPANHRRRLAIGGFGGAALLLAGITFFINLGGKYDVEITVDDPSISLKVDGDDVLIDGAGSTIRLSAGTHTLLMERDGFEAELDDFVVKKEGKNVIHVAVSDGKTMIARTPEKQPEKKVAPHSPASPGTLISAVEGANNAIQFTGKPSRASMPTLSIPEDIKQFCVEGFVTFGDVNASQQVFGFPYEFILGCGPSGLMLHYAQAASRADLTPNFTPEDSGTYHIAAVFDGDNVRLYVDGRMVGERKTKGGLAPNGRTLDVGYGSDAVIDELRVSDNARYSEDFTPPAASQQFQPDEHTLALYHFDEDHGNVAKDSSGNGHDGKIIGAKWVKAGGDATSEPQVVETSTYPGRFALSFPEREESYVEVATLDSKLMDSLLRDKKLNLTIEFWLLRDKGKIEPHDHYAGWSDSYLFVRSAAGSAYVDGGELGGRGAPPVGFYDAFAPTRTVKNEAVWTHVAAVLINPTEYRLFIDGKLVDTKPAQWGWPGSVDPFQLMAQAAGMMGETRVSTTARYDKDFTPEFDFKPDEHTLALYHFDEGSGDVLKDSSGNGHHGKIVGAKWLQAESAVSSAPAEPGANNALAFSDESTYVECPDVELDFTKPHTMEVWLRADVAYGNLLSWSNRPYPRFVLGAWTAGSGQVVFEQDNYKGARSRSFDRDGWVHVAGVQAEDKCRIYVDGKLAVETDNPLLGDTSERSKGLRIGGGMPYFRSLNGELDEVRVSGVARYSADFTPQRRFQADADTLALYHFDEGTGDVLKDSSGNGHDGRIVGAKWVRPAGGAPSNATRIDLLRDYSPDPTSASEKKPDGTWVIYNGDLEFPRRIQGAYLLSVAFNQTGSYGGELKVLLPVGNSHVELVIPDDVNAENQGAGLHLVDGQPSTVNGTRFSKRKDQTLTTEVRRAGDRWQITAALDGQTFFNDVFNESQFSVAESRQPRQRGVIRIGSTSLTFHIKAVDLWDGTSPSKPPITRSSETAVPTSPRPNGERKSLETSLRFSDPDDEVTIPTLVDDSDALTIELWLQRDSSHLDAHSQIIGFGPESSIGSNADSALDFVMPGVGGEDGPKGGWDIHGVGQPIHVAGVRDPEKNELRLYYDGKLIQTSSGPIRRGSGPLHIASSEYQWAGDGEDHSFSGWIDEIRISKSVRYQADFQPERRFENDSQTTALYHFDEGRGNVLKDVSGNGHDGKIVGAKWVRADSSELPLLNRPSGLKGSLAFPKEAKSAFVDVPSIKHQEWSEKSFTLETWVRRDLSFERAHRMIVGFPFENGIVTDAANGAIVVIGGCEEDSFGSTWSSEPEEQEWTHIAYVKDVANKTLRFYQNGKFIEESSFDPIRLAGRSNSLLFSHDGGHRFAGEISETRFSSSVRYDKNFTPPTNLQPDEQTVALYKFDEGAGDVLTDSSGNGHHGKIIGAKWVKVEDTKQVGSLDTPAQLGADNALAFVDDTTFVHCPGVVIDQRGPYTVEAWIRDENRRGNLLSMRNGDFPRFIGGGLDHGLVLDVAKYKGVGVSDNPIPQTGEWAHVAGVYADGEVRLYVDGELIGSKAVPPVDEMGSATDMNIGGRIHGSNSFGAFKGQIDEVRISNTTRYTDNFTPSRRYDSDEHTLALYHFDEGSGDVLKDSSGNGHHGKITGAKWVRVDKASSVGAPDRGPGDPLTSEP